MDEYKKISEKQLLYFYEELKKINALLIEGKVIVNEALLQDYQTRVSVITGESNWRPISTAPKDGTSILVCNHLGDYNCVLVESRRRLEIGGRGISSRQRRF